MMTAQMYEHLITEGIKGLPSDVLAEITNFVYFVRKRTLDPELFEDELRSVLIHNSLAQLSRSEEQHLDEEFADMEATRR